MNIVLQNITTENNSESTTDNNISESVYNSISQNTTAVLDSYVYQNGKTFVYSESETVEYDTIEQCRDAIDNYFSFYFRQLATIPNVTTGFCYLINLSKVINYFVQSSNLVIQLSDGILTIPCINTTHATNHLNYLDFAYKNNNFAVASAGKTILYVDDDNYSTLTSALAVAVSGDMIVVDKMLSESVILKDGVNIWFNSGSGNIYNSGSANLFYMTDDVHCDIYGYGVFENNSTAGIYNNPLFYIEFDSEVNIGFQEINTIDNRASIYAHPQTGTSTIYRCKGHTITGRPLDSDNNTYLIDSDTVNMSNGNDVTVYPDNGLNTYFYLRNSLISNESDIFGTLYMQSSAASVYDINLINARVINYGSSHAIESPIDETHTVRLFNSLLKADTKPIATANGQNTNVIAYGDYNFMNIENYEDVNLTGQVQIDSNLTIE